ncbi:mannose-6-phosphate isomerase, class I [Microbacterium jejuense]|uniref:mannose-6-phosphate isomerase n=1 Tax=Microbacterium jejuense TaxID=1263637 RepID=A0ABS7HJC0_9MICO|nr:mannose-6-phosphate isomerase, class I [Microbacterium jejuense]MBW9093051.1 mannose-6-phosphate isomerase, class I [Microbacterium jejuense]
MLIPLTNTPRNYSWGSTTFIPQLQGRRSSGQPEAEIWFGDHPADPADTPGSKSLKEVLTAEAADLTPLPYLLKLLAAGSPLSIQAHPSRAQAQFGFAREEAAGIPRDAPERTYRDTNHKPELIVAVSDHFRALVGVRDLAVTRRLLDCLGPATIPLRRHLYETPDSVRSAIGWTLNPGSATEVRAIIAEATKASSSEFFEELELARALNATYPGDAGIVVALLMNLVTLQRGEGLFVPAGVLHAYLDGLGVEVMASSDNVLRGGLTPKHIDVAELLKVLEVATTRPWLVHPRQVAGNTVQYDVPIDDFALRRVTTKGSTTVTIVGPSILLAIQGTVLVTGTSSQQSAGMTPGAALFVSPDERSVMITGEGDVFIAGPGRIVDPIRSR